MVVGKLSPRNWRFAREIESIKISAADGCQVLIWNPCGDLHTDELWIRLLIVFDIGDLSKISDFAIHFDLNGRADFDPVKTRRVWSGISSGRRNDHAIS